MRHLRLGGLEGGAPRRLGLLITIFLASAATAACGGSSSADDGSTTSPGSGSPSPSGSSSGSKSGSGSGSSSGSGSGGSEVSPGDDVGYDAAAPYDTDAGDGDEQGDAGDGDEQGDAGGASQDDGGAAAGDDAGGGSSEGPEAGASCTKGQDSPNEVVMIGDSYLDPAYSNAALDLYADAQDAGALAANTTYRHYYQGGASMNSGDLQFNIPYQYETEAMMDTSVSSPTDIKVIIMDGGGNDVLINDRSCLTSPPPGNTECVTTIQGVLTRATSLLQEMANNGVKDIVYVFYPHLDPNGGGLLPSPNTANATLDYAYPLAEQVCCGTSFTSTTQDYSCSGTVNGSSGTSTRCTFIDTRPAFGDNWATLIKTTDYVHPTPAGAQIIADLIWQTMQNECIAQ